MISNRKWLNTFLTCLFGGFLGLHRFYTGKIKEAVIALIIGVLGLVLTGIGGAIDQPDTHEAALALLIIGGIALVAVFVWELVDLILICLHKFKDGQGAIVMDDIK